MGARSTAKSVSRLCACIKESHFCLHFMDSVKNSLYSPIAMYCCEAIDHVTRAVSNIRVISGKMDDYFVVFGEGCCQKF